jgi:hypothetical protein
MDTEPADTGATPAYVNFLPQNACAMEGGGGVEFKIEWQSSNICQLQQQITIGFVGN